MSLLAAASSPPWSGWIVMSRPRKRAITSLRVGLHGARLEAQMSSAQATGSANAISDSARAPVTPAR